MLPEINGLVKHSIKENLDNYNSLIKSNEFHEWLSIFAGGKMIDCGIFDIARWMKGKQLNIVKIEATNSAELRKKLQEKGAEQWEGAIMGLKVPQATTLSRISRVTGVVIEGLKKNAELNWQMGEHSKEDLEVLLLYY